MKSLAAAVVSALLVASGCAIQPNDNTLPGQVAVGDDGYTVKVHFNDVGNLVPNSTVQEDNVVIGTVASIDTENWQAVVDLRLLRDHPLPKNATFSIGQKTLLGAQYVDVAVPHRSIKGRLSDGDVVTTSRTGAFPATEQVLGAVALLLNNGGLSQISTITGQLSTALNDRVPDTRNLVHHADRLLTVLDRNRGAIVRALESLGALSAGLRKDQGGLVHAFDRIAPGLRVLEQERKTLVSAVTTTARTSNDAVKVVRASRSALLANLDSLGPILTRLGKVSNSLPEALKLALTFPFPVMTTRNGIKGDYMNMFTTFDLRGSSFAKVWLGGLPPALQAGDPVKGPLQGPGSQDATDGSHSGQGLSGLLGGLTGAQDGNSGQVDHGQCLLAVLGLC